MKYYKMNYCVRFYYVWTRNHGIGMNVWENVVKGETELSWVEFKINYT